MEARIESRPQKDRKIFQNARKIEPVEVIIFGAFPHHLGCFGCHLNPSWVQRGSQNAPGGPQNESNGCLEEQSGAKRHAKGAKSEPKAAQKEPNGAKRTPKEREREAKGCQKAVKREPGCD